MIHIVVYDLKGPAGSYPEFFEALKAQGPWWHYLRSTWLVSTYESPETVYETLRPHIRKGDRLLVWQLGSERYGWLPRDAWDWIKRHEQS